MFVKVASVSMVKMVEVTTLFLQCIGRICSTYVQSKDRHYTLTAKLVNKVCGMVACVERSGGFRRHMQAYSVGLGVVCINTFRKGYACQLQ